MATRTGTRTTGRPRDTQHPRSAPPAQQRLSPDLGSTPTSGHTGRRRGAPSKRSPDPQTWADDSVTSHPAPREPRVGAGYSSPPKRSCLHPDAQCLPAVNGGLQDRAEVYLQVWGARLGKVGSTSRAAGPDLVSLALPVGSGSPTESRPVHQIRSGQSHLRP